MLPQFAAYHFTAIGSERMRQGLESIILFDRIHHQVGGCPGKRHQKLLERCKARFVVFEHPAIDYAPRAPVRRGDLLGGYTDQQFFRHSKISACPKYHTPATAPTT